MNELATAKLQEIFRAVFELPDTADVTTLGQSTTQRWDSLTHVALVAALESEFGVSIDAADQLSMTSYDETRLLLAGKGV